MSGHAAAAIAIRQTEMFRAKFLYPISDNVRSINYKPSPFYLKRKGEICLLTTIERINEVLSKIAYWILVIMMAMMSIICFSQVIARGVFHFVPSWMEEACRFLLIWCSFLGAAVTLRKGGHACVTVLVNFFPFQIKRYVAITVDICMLAFYGVLTYQSVVLVERYIYRVAETMDISMAYVFLAFPVSFGLMVFYSVEEIVRLFVAPEGVLRLQVRIDNVEMLPPAELGKSSKS